MPIHARNGDTVRVLRSARDGLAACPGDLQAMRRLSLALVEHGDSTAEIDEGIALVRRTIEVDPSNAFAHAALGRGLARRGDRDGAAAAFGRALQIAPDSSVIRSMASDAGVSVRAAPVSE